MDRFNNEAYEALVNDLINDAFILKVFREGGQSQR